MFSFFSQSFEALLAVNAPGRTALGSSSRALTEELVAPGRFPGPRDTRRVLYRHCLRVVRRSRRRTG